MHLQAGPSPLNPALRVFQQAGSGFSSEIHQKQVPEPLVPKSGSEGTPASSFPHTLNLWVDCKQFPLSPTPDQELIRQAGPQYHA